MSKLEFKVGDRVREAYDLSHKGEVISIINREKVGQLIHVKWDSGQERNYYEDELQSETLAQEFDEILEKVQTAANSLSEANEMLKAKGKSIHYCNGLMEPLFNVMDKMGWSTSSLKC